MFKLFVYLYFLNYLCSQKTIEVFVDNDDTVINFIEKEILFNVFKLYNAKNKNKLSYKIIKVNFKDIFRLLEFDESNLKMSLSSITVSSERLKKFSFSNLYIPTKTVVFSLNKNQNWKDKVIGYQQSTIHEIIANDIKQNYKNKIKAYKQYDELLSAIYDGKLEFAISDNIEVWNDKRLKIVSETQMQIGKGIAIMYPKNSVLKDTFNKYLIYYLKSAKFTRLIRTKFGKDVSEYFRKNLIQN